MQQTNDYTISETFTLPSKGLIYETKIDPNITLRSMTTQEEMQRLSPSDLPYKNMCDILDACIINKIGISTYDFCMADYQFILQRLRIVTYGVDYSLVSSCPYCGTNNKGTIDLSDLPVTEYDDNIISYLKFDLPRSKVTIELNYQTPRMMDSATINTKEYKKKTDSRIDMTTAFIVQELIKTIDGEKPNRLRITDWVRKLPMMDTNTILAYMEKFNKSMGVDSHLHCICDLCGLDYYTSLKANREFFRPSVAI